MGDDDGAADEGEKKGATALAGFNETVGRKAGEDKLEIICRRKIARRDGDGNRCVVFQAANVAGKLGTRWSSCVERRRRGGNGKTPRWKRENRHP